MASNNENEFHNKLKTMKSENCKDFWAALNEHSSNDPHKFVINLEVFKKNIENLNRNPRKNHQTRILNSQLIAISYTSETKYMNMPYTMQEVTAANKRVLRIIGYEPADLTVHPPPKQSRVGSFFSHRCLVPPKFFPQRKSGFCRRYSH